jgi:hypothetical protein
VTSTYNLSLTLTFLSRAVSGKETDNEGYSFSTITIRILEVLNLLLTEVLFPVKINSKTVKGKNNFPSNSF